MPTRAGDPCRARQMARLTSFDAAIPIPEEHRHATTLAEFEKATAAAISRFQARRRTVLSPPGRREGSLQEAADTLKVVGQRPMRKKESSLVAVGPKTALRQKKCWG